MKNLAIIASILLVAVIACMTNNEKNKVENAVMEYVNTNFEYPKGAEITGVKYDTVITNHLAREMMDFFTDPSQTVTKLIYDCYVGNVDKSYIESYDTMAMFDTCSPDVAYIVATATVRHRCNKNKDLCICNIFLLMQNDKILKVFRENELDVQQIEKILLPTEIRKIKEVSEVVLHGYNEILSEWER